MQAQFMQLTVCKCCRYSQCIVIYSRLSGLLADLFQEVLATDCRDDYVAKNKAMNQSPNIIHSVVNATKFPTQFAADSLDMVFSNWLFMYMSNEEIQGFAQDALRFVLVVCTNSI